MKRHILSGICMVLFVNAARDQITNNTSYALTVELEYPGWFCTNNRFSLNPGDSHSINAGTCSLGALTVSSSRPSIHKRFTLTTSDTPSISRNKDDFQDILINQASGQQGLSLHFRTEQERIDEGRQAFNTLFK